MKSWKSGSADILGRGEMGCIRVRDDILFYTLLTLSKVEEWEDGMVPNLA